MFLGNQFPKAPFCPLCKKEITTAQAHHASGSWFHRSCFDLSLSQQKEAEDRAQQEIAARVAARFGFNVHKPPPFASITEADVNKQSTFVYTTEADATKTWKKRYDPNRLWTDNPQHFNR